MVIVTGDANKCFKLLYTSTMKTSGGEEPNGMKNSKKPPYVPTKQEILDCMQHDAYRRVGRKIRQIRWSKHGQT